MGLYVGLMSGTSMDAIDAALVEIAPRVCRAIAAAAVPLEPALRGRIAQLIEHPGAASLDDIATVDIEVAQAFAAATMSLLTAAGVRPGEVAAIGSHGQTLRHRPDAAIPFTWQVGDPHTLAELTGIKVVADFRRRDVAAGGQGAPLVPVFHDSVFRSDAEDRAIVNIGGIANITLLRRGAPPVGFDCGPGNRLLDAWITATRQLDYDHDGDWAASGQIDPELLKTLMMDPYFALPPPKSTGRELFNLAWLEAQLRRTATPGRPRPAADVQATLVEFTAATIAAGVAMVAGDPGVYVCGGGAHNPLLMSALARRLAPARVATTAELGVDPDYVEAIAFAWFAHRTLNGETSSLPSVSGARHPRILGGIFQ